MPTLYVENVPKNLYQALRKRARENRNSIAAEVISLLERNIPTTEQLRQRREFYERIAQSRTRQPERAGPFPTVEEMIREDRNR